MRETTRLLLALIALLCWLLVYLWDRARRLDYAEFVAEERLLAGRSLIEENHYLRQQMILRRGASR